MTISTTFTFDFLLKEKLFLSKMYYSRFFLLAIMKKKDFLFSLVDYRFSVICNIIKEEMNGRQRSYALTVVCYLFIRPLVVQHTFLFYWNSAGTKLIPLLEND